MKAINGEGKENSHQPVLYHESLKYLQPESGMCFVDGTLGAGGHAFGILSATKPAGKLLGIDLDRDAIAIATEKLERFGSRVIIRHDTYNRMGEIIEEIGWNCVDGIILDLGISSMQVDQDEKGFSFSREAPLDMRFNRDSGLSAAELLNSLSEEEIAEIIWKYGEETKSRKIASAIIQNRPIETTTHLAQIVKEAVHLSGSKIHPATKTFQALRIAVNRELEVLEEGLSSALVCLCRGARIAVITFHSLEDRIVKQFFIKESKDCICPPEQVICTCGHSASLKILTKKPVVPTAEEIKENPRARSAKLRVAEKL